MGERAGRWPRGAAPSSLKLRPSEFQWVTVWGWGGGVALFSSPACDPDPAPTSLLQTLSTQFRQAPGQTQDGQPWTYHLVRFADLLLSHSRNVVPLVAFTTQQRQAWDR